MPQNRHWSVAALTKVTNVNKDSMGNVISKSIRNAVQIVIAERRTCTFFLNTFRTERREYSYLVLDFVILKDSRSGGTFYTVTTKMPNGKFNKGIIQATSTDEVELLIKVVTKLRLITISEWTFEKMDIDRVDISHDADFFAAYNSNTNGRPFDIDNTNSVAYMEFYNAYHPTCYEIMEGDMKRILSE